MCSSSSEKVPRRLPPGSPPALPSLPLADKAEQPPASRPGLSLGGMPLEGFQKCSLWQLRHLTLLLSLWVGEGGDRVGSSVF